MRHGHGCDTENSSGASQQGQDERTLPASATLYRTLAANLPGGVVFVVDRELRYLLAEGQVLAEAGMRPADFEGKTIFEVLEPELAQRYEPYYRRALTGESFQREHGGYGRHFVSHGAPLYDEAGEVYAVLTVSYDITQRKRVEEALAASEAKYATAFQAGPLGLTLTRLADGRLYEVNDHFLRFAGYQRQEVLGKTPAELGIWLEPEKRLQGLEQLRRGQSVRNIEAQFRVKNGSIRTCLVSGDLVEIGGETYAQTALIDISERKQVEAALRASEARFRHLTNAVPPLVWTTDAAGRPTYFNDGWLSYTGLMAEEALKPGGVIRVMHPEDFPSAAATWHTESAAGGSFSYEYRLRRHDGVYEWHLARATPIFEGESVVEWIGSALNIENRKRAEQERERLLAEVNRLNETLEQRVKERTQQVQSLASELTLAEARERSRLAQLLHDDLQQQIFAVQFAVSALKREVAEQPEVLAQIDAVIRLLRETVHSARRITQEFSLPKGPGRDIVSSLAALTTDMKERYDLRVMLDAPLHLGGTSMSDDLRFFTVNLLRELLFNVVKHAGVKEATVRINEAPQWFELTVADDGRGFDPSALETEGQGTGLGLAGVQKRLQLFDGRLDIDSAPGQGTRVTIRLPRRAPGVAE